uniref:C-JID domain-containing protein n=1 Tax=Populus alba TaxID=43335 RepID=A0A4U5NSJ9_POPAL|nr:hypothetical protein D5086_0000242090 [Populus alba]
MAKNLERLRLEDCPSLTEVPSSLQYLDKLEEIDLRGCYNLRSFPMLDSKVLSDLLISRCLDVTMCPTISQNMTQITKFPEISGDITILELKGTPIKEVPSSIQFLTRLRWLNMSCCSKLESFPEITVPMKWFAITPIKELPLSIKDMVRNVWICMEHLLKRNCFKLDQKQLIEAMHLKIQSGEEIPYGRIQMVLPGSEIPEWFGDKGIGSSLTIQFPSNCHQLKGIAFCLVFLGPFPNQQVCCNYHVKGKNGFAFWEEQILTDVLVSCDSYHMILHYELKLGNHLRKYSGNEVTFNFHDRGVYRRPFEFKSCGVYLHFDENLPADKSSKEN